MKDEMFYTNQIDLKKKRKEINAELVRLKTLKDQRTSEIKKIESKYPDRLSDEIWKAERQLKYNSQIIDFNKRYLIIGETGDLQITKIDAQTVKWKYFDWDVTFGKYCGVMRGIKKESIICPVDWIIEMKFTHQKNNRYLVFRVKTDKTDFAVSQNLGNNEISVSKR